LQELATLDPACTIEALISAQGSNNGDNPLDTTTDMDSVIRGGSFSLPAPPSAEEIVPGSGVIQVRCHPGVVQEVVI
jgi:hypothetical protein